MNNKEKKTSVSRGKLIAGYCLLLVSAAAVCFSTYSCFFKRPSGITATSANAVPAGPRIGVTASGTGANLQTSEATQNREEDRAGFQGVHGGGVPGAGTPPAGAERFPGARVLAIREEPTEEGNTVQRTRFLATDLKYPLVRVEETVLVDPVAGSEKVRHVRAMAGDHIIVKLKSGISEQELAALNETFHARTIAKIDAKGTYLVAFDNPGIDTVPDAVASYCGKKEILHYAEPDFVVFADQLIPNDPLFGELWGMHNTGQSGGTVDADIDAPEAWDAATGNNVIVAVIDTGVDYTHPDLAANMWINAGEIAANGVDDDGNGYVDDIYGIDACNSDTDPFDDHGHGTHCSGTIAGAGNNNVGVAGVCWQARIMGAKFLSAGGSGFSSDAIICINYAAMMGARVMNNSWGGSGYSAALFDAIEDANNSNALFCAAAGNSGTDNDVSPHYPSSYTNANVLSVAASTRADALSSFSCYGLKSVDLAAPGSSILSTLPGNSYVSWSGTSMATPHCSGAAALILSRNSAVSAEELKRILVENTDPVAAFNGKMVSGGRLNVARSLSRVFGVSFDKAQYFSDTWATIAVSDTSLAGSAGQVVQMSSSHGDSETLTLYPQVAGGSVFTNRIFIGFGVAEPGNGALEGMHGVEVSASYMSPGAGKAITGRATVYLGLDIAILTPSTVVPFTTTAFSVAGSNNGNVLVSMVVSNAATGEAIAFAATNGWTAPAVALSTTGGVNVIRVSGSNTYGFSDSDSITITRYGPSSATNYVSKTGLHRWPYTDWATAATKISAAIAAAADGNLVLVTNGTYAGETATVGRPMIINSVNGPSVTIIDGQNVRRCASLESNAVLSGFTLTRGKAYNGGGIYIYDRGMASNCVIIANRGTGWGGGVHLLGGGTVINSLIVSNTADVYAGGVFLNIGGSLLHCTVADNNAGDSGGGLFCNIRGDVKNTIVYFNTAPASPNIRINGSGISIFMNYLCTIPTNGLPVLFGCITSNPAFFNRSAGDYHLQSGSPCVDTGTNVSGVAIDLDGWPRVLDGDTNGTAVTDIGAYEYLHPQLDTDGDGMPDAWEMANGLDRFVNDASADPDADGLANLQEYQNSTNPHNADTDGDGYNDRIELQSGSNPQSAASIPSVSLVITTPSLLASFSTTNATVDLAGTLAAHAAVTSIVVSNSRHIASNTCPIAATWSFSGMPIYSGNNVITITATDVLGKRVSDVITVTRTGDFRYNDLLFSGAIVQEVNFPDNLVPGSTVTVQWKSLSYVPLRARLGTGSKTQGWYLFKNAEYTGMQASPWNISGRNASVYAYQCAYVVPTNTGDFSVWFNHGQMDGTTYMSAVVPDGVDARPDLAQSKLITRTIVAGGTNANPQSDGSITDTQNPFETSQQALMRSGGTVVGVNIPTNGWSVSNNVTCQWTILSYAPIYSKIFLLNLAGQRILLQATGTLIGIQNSTWHIGSTYAKEYTFQAQVTVPDEVGVQQIYFLDMQQGVAGASWMAGNIPAGADPRPALYNGMYGRFIERTIVP